MDRCRCPDYAAAVKKLRFYTVGTHRPDIIDDYDRTGYAVSWFKIGISYGDMKFVKPKARKILALHELPENRLSGEAKKIERMWCPFMTPYVEGLPADEKERYKGEEDEQGKEKYEEKNKKNVKFKVEIH